MLHLDWSTSFAKDSLCQGEPRMRRRLGETANTQKKNSRCCERELSVALVCIFDFIFIIYYVFLCGVIFVTKKNPLLLRHVSAPQ